MYMYPLLIVCFSTELPNHHFVPQASAPKSVEVLGSLKTLDSCEVSSSKVKISHSKHHLVGNLNLAVELELLQPLNLSNDLHRL